MSSMLKAVLIRTNRSIVREESMRLIVEIYHYVHIRTIRVVYNHRRKALLMTLFTYMYVV